MESTIHTDLTKLFQDNKNLRIAHININGLQKSLDKLKLLVLCADLDILAISETHLCDTTSDNDIMIENYELLRKDRNNESTPWGGVAIYFKSTIHAYEHKSDHDIEAVWLDTMIKGQRLLIAAVYRPPQKNTFLNTFSKALADVSHRTNIVILGDFNIDLSTPSAGATNYKSILHINNLSNIIVDHTRVTDSSNTLIDHILISDTSKITISGTYDACLSDHKLIYAVVNLRKPPKPPIFKTIRNYKDVDWEVIKREFQQTPWWITTTFDNINDTCWAWQKLYDEIINKHIKSRRVKIKAQSHP